MTSLICIVDGMQNTWSSMIPITKFSTLSLFQGHRHLFVRMLSGLSQSEVLALFKGVDSTDKLGFFETCFWDNDHDCQGKGYAKDSDEGDEGISEDAVRVNVLRVSVNDDDDEQKDDFDYRTDYIAAWYKGDIFKSTIALGNVLHPEKNGRPAYLTESLFLLKLGNLFLYPCSDALLVHVAHRPTAFAWYYQLFVQ